MAYRFYDDARDAINRGMAWTSAQKKSLRDAILELVTNRAADYVVLDPAPQVTVDLREGNVFDITLDQNVALTLTNAVPAQHCTFIVRQNASGGYTCSFSPVSWFAGTIHTVTATANAVDIIAVVTDADGVNHASVASLDSK